MEILLHRRGSSSPEAEQNLTEHVLPLIHGSIHSRSIPTDSAADGQGACGLPLPEGRVTEEDFIGSAVLSTALFPLKGEGSNHKGIFDEVKFTGELNMCELSREEIQSLQPM